MDNELLQAISDMMDSKLSIIIANMATKDDLQSAKMDLYEEIIRAEKAIDNVDEKLKGLREEVNSTRYSNQAVELLMKRQDKMEQELENLKKKIS